MRVADYIAEYVSRKGVGIAFMVVGGGMVYLSDGIARHPRLQALCCHHEQAAAMAAVGYAKYKNDLGVCYVTTGCGGTNAMTGLLNAWQDSAPVLFISGQVPKAQTIRETGHNLRQFGTQEADIIALVRPITKYAEVVRDPNDIGYHMDKATTLATTGRPGPVWLDVPMDVAKTDIEPYTLIRYLPDKKNITPEWGDSTDIWRLLNVAKAPVLVIGNGVRKAGAVPAFLGFLDKYKIPVVTTFMAADIVPWDSPYYLGRIGNKGNEAANRAVREADAVVVIGSRLSINSTGYDYAAWAPTSSKTVVVDIDNMEHRKNTVRIDQFVMSDAKLLFERLNKLHAVPERPEWLTKCTGWKVKRKASVGAGIDVYAFLDGLGAALPDDAVVVADAGSAFFATARGMPVQKGQRIILSGGQAEMGFTLPATMGVCCSRDFKQTIGITGDGSFQMNIQELQTIAHNKLPIVLFVWNNDGYLSIRATQDKLCDGLHIGTDSTCGISFPSVEKIARAYGIKYYKLASGENLEKQIAHILAYPKAVICEVMCQRDQEIMPVEVDHE